MVQYLFPAPEATCFPQADHAAKTCSAGETTHMPAPRGAGAMIVARNWQIAPRTGHNHETGGYASRHSQEPVVSRYLFSQLSGGICICGNNPKCRHDHRVKQHPRWNVTQNPDGTFTWTTPSGRSYTTEPTRYPI